MPGAISLIIQSEKTMPSSVIRNVKIKGKPLDPNKEYVVAVYGGPPPMGVEPEKKNIREIVIDYIRKRKDVEVERKPNVKVLDHPYNTECYWR